MKRWFETKIRGIKVDIGLKFKIYSESVIQKASNTVNALYRVTPFFKFFNSITVHLFRCFIAAQ